MEDLHINVTVTITDVLVGTAQTFAIDIPVTTNAGEEQAKVSEVMAVAGFTVGSLIRDNRQTVLQSLTPPT